ncbi:MAG: heme exporter protein CcmB [Deltaproteobacteria bacterium]|nr:heme exporter protein CcmB [Deltaproteobacteria bacterium]
MPRPNGFVSTVLRIAAKDLRIEWRNREITTTMGFFAILMVLIFAFAFVNPAGDALAPEVTAGVLWVGLLFSGTIALARTFDRERDLEAVRALLLSPAPRAAIYLGKLVGVVFLMLIVETAVTLLSAVFFSAAIGRHAAWLAGFLALGTVGYAAVGTVVSGALLRSKSRDALIAALLFPLVTPLVMAGVRGTSMLLNPETPDPESIVFWTQFLVVVDAVFLLIGLWAFEPVISGE